MPTCPACQFPCFHIGCGCHVRGFRVPGFEALESVPTTAERGVPPIERLCATCDTRVGRERLGELLKWLGRCDGAFPELPGKVQREDLRQLPGFCKWVYTGKLESHESVDTAPEAQAMIRDALEALARVYELTSYTGTTWTNAAVDEPHTKGRGIIDDVLENLGSPQIIPPRVQQENTGLMGDTAFPDLGSQQDAETQPGSVSMIIQDQERGASFAPQQGEHSPSTANQDAASEDSWPELQDLLENCQRETNAIVRGQAAAPQENIDAPGWTWSDFPADAI